MTTIKNLLKKILPQFMINRIKVFLGEHPYVFHPLHFLFKGKYTRELKTILANHKGAKGIIVYPPTIDWHMPLFQRPQQLAKAFAKEGYLFFYCTNNLRFDKVKGFKEVEKNLYLCNQMEIGRAHV